MFKGGETLFLLTNIPFVVNRGKPLVNAFLDGQRTIVPRGELEHYAAALQSFLQTERYATPNREHATVVEAMEKKYPKLTSTFRTWYYETYIRS